MRQDKFSKAYLTLYACGVIPVVWLALLLAPYMGGGLVGLVRYGGAALDHPFHIVWCEDSLKTVLIFLLCYGLGIGVYLSTDRNYRRREEHGSARWGDPKGINRKYADKELTANKILTQNVAIGLDGRRHRRNLNVLVVGGSGAGKTRFYAKPNIMNANTSLIVLDCKGEILRDTGGLLEANGYDIKVLDLNNMEKSHCYNPFAYLRSDNDIQRLVTNLFKNTTPKGAQSQDPFWDQAAQMGGNEQSTHEYVSKLLGKETIDTNTYGQSKGRSGSYSTNWQLTGRELLMPDEVRMLDNQYALLFIRGERPVRDLKYDILKHPNIKLTTDGGAEPYRHGEDVHSIVSIRFDKELLKQAAEKDGQDAPKHRFILLTEDELEQKFIELEEQENAEQQKGK